MPKRTYEIESVEITYDLALNKIWKQSLIL